MPDSRGAPKNERNSRVMLLMRTPRRARDIRNLLLAVAR
jgi:hypothetical protein